MTSKLNNFNNLQDFQINFKLTLSKLYDSGKPLLKDLQIAALLHGVEKTFNQWAFAKQFTIRGKRTDDPLPTVDDLTAKLMDKYRANVWGEATSLIATKDGYSDDLQSIVSLSHIWDNLQLHSVRCQVYSVLCFCLYCNSESAKDYIFLLLCT